MKFGLSDEEFNILNNLVVEPLSQQGCRVWVFGSRARGSHQPFSDIDILFECQSNKNLPSGLLSQIQEACEDSRLNFKVDIVSLNDLAHSYIESVMKDRVLISPLHEG